jgi:transcription elongation factor Elf1
VIELKIVDIAVRKVYRFNCPNCQSRLEAEVQELVDIGGKVCKFFCPVCRKDRYITWSELRKKIIYDGSH